MLRKWITLAAASAWIALPASAQLVQVRPGAAQRELDALLGETTAERIATMRSACALGEAPASRRRITAAGLETSSAAAWCVTVLTRAGRDGTLGYVRDPRSNQLTPAIAFDNGFVAGYLKRETIPANAPDMAAMLPIAERCLALSESSTQRCNSAGYVLGARAVRGEVVAAR